MHLWAAIAVISVVTLASCAGNSGPKEDPPAAEWTDAQREAEIDKRIEARRQLADRQPARVPTNEPAAVTGEVPVELLDAIRTDLGKRLGIETTDLEPVRAEAVNWNDGSLGCPRPDQVYTQSITPGYHVVFEFAGTAYDYRAKRNGLFMLCELPVTIGPGQPTK